MGDFGEEILNRSGIKILEFCIESELLIENIYIRDKIYQTILEAEI